MNINEAKTLLNEKFGEYHLFDITNTDFEDDSRYAYVTFIAHENMQKDVWFTIEGIDTVIEVPYDQMGADEQARWTAYTNKQE